MTFAKSGVQWTYRKEIMRYVQQQQDTPCPTTGHAHGAQEARREHSAMTASMSWLTKITVPDFMNWRR